jgi:hypothetical protein
MLFPRLRMLLRQRREVSTMEGLDQGNCPCVDFPCPSHLVRCGRCLPAPFLHYCFFDDYEATCHLIGTFGETLLKGRRAVSCPALCPGEKIVSHSVDDSWGMLNFCSLCFLMLMSRGFL